jgi:hypothetical protein
MVREGVILISAPQEGQLIRDDDVLTEGRSVPARKGVFMRFRRSPFVLAILGLILAAAAGAQSLHNSDAYFGYSRLGSDTFYPNVGGLNGWNAAVHIHMRPFLGVEGDVGHYGLGADSTVPRTTTYLVGPRVTLKALRVAVFAHGLLGGEHSSNSSGVNVNGGAFAYALGGGVDLPVVPFFAFRVGADRITAPSLSPGSGQKYRVNAGLVLRF